MRHLIYLLVTWLFVSFCFDFCSKSGLSHLFNSQWQHFIGNSPPPSSGPPVFFWEHAKVPGYDFWKKIAIFRLTPCGKIQAPYVDLIKKRLLHNSKHEFYDFFLKLFLKIAKLNLFLYKIYIRSLNFPTRSQTKINYSFKNHAQELGHVLQKSFWV